MCFVWIWEQTAIFSLYSTNWLSFITERKCVYCAVRAGYLNIIQDQIKFYVLPTQCIYVFCVDLRTNSDYFTIQHQLTVLGAPPKLRKATICFVMSICPSVCPSVRMEQLGSHWTDFHEIWYLGIFRKSVHKIQIQMKSDKNNGYFHEDLCIFMTIPRWILLRVINISDK